MTGTGLSFDTWIGRRYKSGAAFGGLKVLICGESAPDKSRPEGRAASINRVRDYLKKVKIGKATANDYSFWLWSEAVVSAGLTRACEAGALWNDVAFNNLIQRIEGVGVSQNEKDWTSVGGAFATIVRTEEPDLAFIFSQSAWRHLPDHTAFPGSEEIDLIGPAGRRAYLYLYNALVDDEPRRCLAVPFYHPVGMRRAENRKANPIARADWRRFAKQAFDFRRHLASKPPR